MHPKLIISQNEIFCKSHLCPVRRPLKRPWLLSREEALSGKGASAFRRSRRCIVRGVEHSSLAPERVAVDALGQALEIRVRDAARSEVLSPSVNRPDDANDFGSGLRRRVAKELALRHGVGKR